MTHRAYLSLGSNLGERSRAMLDAIERLGRLPETRVSRVADPIETLPVDCPPGSPNYLNSAAVLETRLEPLPLLRALLSIEADLGRRRPGPQQPTVRNAPRPIDLDLLLYDDRIIDQPPELIVPHPRMHLRRFVLEPLASIAPDVVHPTLGTTVAALLTALP